MCSAYNDIPNQTSPNSEHLCTVSVAHDHAVSQSRHPRGATALPAPTHLPLRSYCMVQPIPLLRTAFTRPFCRLSFYLQPPYSAYHPLAALNGPLLPQEPFPSCLSTLPYTSATFSHQGQADFGNHSETNLKYSLLLE